MNTKWVPSHGMRVVCTAALVSLAAATLSACSTTHNYVIKNVSNEVALADSKHHVFEYVSVKETSGELVVYGKVQHKHTVCDPEGHVDLAVLGPTGEAAYEASLPIIRGPSKQRGWAGASFRAKLPVQLGEQSQVRLAFHDEHCRVGGFYDCGGNVASSAAGAPPATLSHRGTLGP